MKQIKNLLKSNMYGNLITHFQLILNNFAHLAFISNCLSNVIIKQSNA